MKGGENMSEELIRRLEEKYGEKVTKGKVLDKAEVIIINYYNELSAKLYDVIDYSEEEVDIIFWDDTIIVKMTINDDFIYFTRKSDCIKIFMSNCTVDTDCDLEVNEYYRSIIPDKGEPYLGESILNYAKLDNVIGTEHLTLERGDKDTKSS